MLELVDTKKKFSYSIEQYQMRRKEEYILTAFYRELQQVKRSKDNHYGKWSLSIQQ